MIFRRIKAHIAKEDWFAVFIDFLIVVFVPAAYFGRKWPLVSAAVMRRF